MASIKTRLRSIRKRASKRTNPKNNMIEIAGDDFWWIMNLIYQADKIDQLETNLKLQERIKELEGVE
ncbi:hypothetical protein ACIQYS_09640 [Psychrobacillus sp. NPDC096426]|uniref:hypothetical protein n=1 Tax=Psychrobacillus sp. NPDC096426 TaxID=3364491 RepID=UPI0037F1E460